jgi:hypothetical protein
MLPKLKEGAKGITAVDHIGWNDRRFSELQGISASLDVPKEYALGISVDAIPDIWARLLVFAYALEDNEHQLYKDALNGFRGFLTLLALQKARGMQIETRRLELNRESGTGFVSAVRRLPPTGKTISSDATWDEIVLFLVEGEVIGVTSPLTLVCPRDVRDVRVLDKYRFTDGLRFRNPMEYLGEEERRLLAAWVEQLKKRVAASPVSDPLLSEKITTHLNEFGKELLKGITGKGEDARYVQVLSLAGSLYSCLNEAIDLPEVPSDVQLRSVRGAEPSGKRLILVDLDLDRKWKKPANQIRLAPGITLDAIKGIPLGPEGSTLGPYNLPLNCDWKSAENLLLPRLTVMEVEDAFPGATKIDGQDQIARTRKMSFILPISDALLAYVTADYLKRSMRCREVADGIEFEIDLPVADSNVIQAKRVYRWGELNRGDGKKIPIMEIWPGFASTDWKCWFTFWSSEGVADRIFCELHPEGQIKNRWAEMKGEAKEREVCELEAPPEFVGCFETPALPGQARRRRYLGVLLPNLPAAEQLGGIGKCEIGFDFGTTNTNIYMKINDDKARALQLDTNIHPLCASSPLERLQILFSCFLPPSQEKAPFFSLLRVRPGQSGLLNPIGQAHVFFYNDTYNRPAFNRADVLAYLKWEEKKEDERLCLLKQLALHCAVEAAKQGVGGLTFHYSFPTAFSKDMESFLRSSWGQIKEWIEEVTGLRCEAEDPQTEAVAAAQYFAHLDPADGIPPALTQVGAIVVDIGGGTTDISIWQSGKFRLQSSIRLCGREILIEPLYLMRNTILGRLVERVGPSIEESLNDLIKIDERSKFCRSTDAILRSRENEKEILKGLYAFFRDEEYSRFRSLLAILLGGLFYYTGLLLRSLGDDSLNFEDLPDVYVGGNGSKIFHWLTPPTYSTKDPIHELFKRMMLRGAGMGPSTKHLNIHLSKEPKCEAAIGLLYSGEVPKEAQGRAGDRMISGEPFRVGSQSKSEIQTLSAEDLLAGAEASELTSLADFIDAYNEFTRDYSLLGAVLNPKDVLARAKKTVTDWCGQQRSKEAPEIRPEPLFVVGLKKACEFIHQQQWAGNR